MAQNLRIEYEYDESGNRTGRKTIYMNTSFAPSAPPQDSTEFTSSEPDALESLKPPKPPKSTNATNAAPTEETEYFVEKVAQTEIKIYPNPTTEKVTLEISGWESLQNGMFQLFSLNGQLLQTQPVHSLITTVSLSGMPAGAYILKVQINGRVEKWKIIKN